MSANIVERPLAPRCLEWRIEHEARRNAVSPRDLEWIRGRCEALDGEIVVLTGAGEAAFCAGFDLQALAQEVDALDAVDDLAAAPDRSLMAATAAMHRARAVFIAALNGPVVGAGVELAVTCDLRVACPRASLQVPAARLGVVYHADGLARMHAVLGPALTRRMLLTNARVDARTAHDHGAIDELTEDAETARTRAAALAAEIAELAPLSVLGNRRLLRSLDAARLPAEALEAHLEARRRAYASEDHAEARRAVAQRRPPRFQGK